MSSPFPAGPHDSLADKLLSKAQGLVSSECKNNVSTISPNRGIHAFLLQHAYQNVSDFIKLHNLTWLEADRVANYIANGFRDPCASTDSGIAGNPDGRAGRGRSSRKREKTPELPDIGANTKESTGGGR